MADPIDGGGLIDRREFTLQFALAALAGATVTIVPACGGGGGSPAGPSPGPGGGGSNVSGVVTANHGHIASIDNARLSAGDAITLDIRGDADHPHTVMLTSAQVMQIAARQRVSVESSNDVAHSHFVVFN